MLEFSTVLTEVASRTEQRSPQHVPRPLDLFDLPSGSYAHHDAVTEACGAAPRAIERCSGDPPPPDVHEFDRALTAAKADVRRLRALRRTIAWALHPDRVGAPDRAAMLADFNARLDAALDTATRE